ncbi:hypothetical protein AB5I41_23245 [Sphingomonas sp. MMS24-JH45]
MAIVLMHGWRFTDHEARLAAIARDVGFAQVSASHATAPIRKLVARGDTTLADAYLSPALDRYTAELAAALGEPLFMQSSGGLAARDAFAARMRCCRGRRAGSSAWRRPHGRLGSTMSSGSTWAAPRPTCGSPGAVSTAAATR